MKVRCEEMPDWFNQLYFSKPELVKALCYDDEPQYTPIQILDMFFGIVEKTRIDCFDSYADYRTSKLFNCANYDIYIQEMLLNFLVFMNVEV